MTRALTLRWGAWAGDAPLRLSVPDTWDLSVMANLEPPALEPDEVRRAFHQPIGAPKLGERAAGARRVAVVIDDLTRPTPTAELLPLILEALAEAGVAREAVTIVIGGGTHRPATPDEIRQKVGAALLGAIRVVPHDALGDTIWRGRSARGTPVWVNPCVADAELIIGVGAICPHSVAGFSGGSKTIVPGVCGLETAQAIHDHQPGVRYPGESLTNAFRREVDAVAELIGLHYVVNVVLTPERRIAGLFAGSPAAAYEAGVRAAQGWYTVPRPGQADIVIANAYPLDTSVKFMGRAFWPLQFARPGSAKVLIGASCLEDMGLARDGHGPSPWAGWRLPRLPRPRDVGAMLRMLRAKARRQAVDYLMLCPGISETRLRRRYPRVRAFAEWAPLRALLETRQAGRRMRVAVYPYAPLQMPGREG